MSLINHRAEQLSRLTRLLNHAASSAAAELAFLNDGVPPPATPDGLDALCHQIRRCIELQVNVGMWKKLGVEEFPELEAFRVSARLGLHEDEPGIVLSYDFKGTSIAWAKIKMLPSGEAREEAN